MRLLFLLVCVCISRRYFTSCSHPDNKKSAYPIAQQKLNDTSEFAVIAFDPNHDWPFKHSYKPATLSVDEIKRLDSILKECVQNHNQSLAPDLKESYSIDFPKFHYKRQYIAVLNDNGEKEVWINGFCDTWDKAWKTEILLVKDGGNCYFNLKINLVTGTCFEVSVNGYA